MGRRRHALALTLLLLVIAALYGRTLDDGWHYDDLGELRIEGVRDGFPRVEPGHYRGIVTLLTWAADARWWGENPVGFHLTNIVLHALVAIGTYLLAWILGRGRPAAARFTAALLAGLILATHPLATQVASYVTQRSTSLATWLMVVTLILWAWAIRPDRSRRGEALRLALAASVFFAALHAKHVAASAPLLLLLLDRFLRPDRPLPALAVRLAPFVLLLGVRALPFAGRIAGILDEGAADAPVVGADVPSDADGYQRGARGLLPTSPDPWTYLLTQTRVVVLYVRLLVFPVGQRLLHDVRPSMSPLEPAVLGSLVLLVGFAVLAWRLRRRAPVVSLGVAFLLLAFLPTSSIVPGRHFMFEHRAYPALVGFALAAAAGLEALTRGRGTLLRGVAFLPVVLFSLATHLRNEVWSSERALWTEAVERAPRSAPAHLNLGLALQQEGRAAEAVAHYRRVLELRPDDAPVRVNLGNLARDTGRLDEAERWYREAMELAPWDDSPRWHLGNVMLDRGRVVEAERLYRRALELRPEAVPPRYNLAKCLERMGRLREAVDEYERVARAHPGDRLFTNDLGCAVLHAGDPVRAVTILEEAVALDADWPVACFNLGLAHEASGRPDRATRAFREALRRDPSLEPAREALLRLGDAPAPQ